MKTRMAISIAAATMLLVAGGCASDNEEPGLPNPAAVFCEDQGGTTSGPEPMCKLPDGSIVDAWEYFLAEGAPG